MISQVAECVRGANMSMLSPGFLIDRLLDQIERLSDAMVPAQADGRSCEVSIGVQPTRQDETVRSTGTSW
jgi:hypothetical protein